jgi:hypothetical protein
MRTSCRNLLATRAVKMPANPVVGSRVKLPKIDKVPAVRCRSLGEDVALLSPQPASWLGFLAGVEIELVPQVFLCADVVVVVGVGREELVLALRAASRSWDFVVVLQDDEAALHGRFIRSKQRRVGTLRYAHFVRHINTAWSAMLVYTQSVHAESGAKE